MKTALRLTLSLLLCLSISLLCASSVFAESEEGEETYAHTAILNLSNVTSGGLVWDNVGTEWDSIGAVWEAGGAGGFYSYHVLV